MHIFYQATSLENENIFGLFIGTVSGLVCELGGPYKLNSEIMLDYVYQYGMMQLAGTVPKA